jgi:hypothetical protein
MFRLFHSKRHDFILKLTVFLLQKIIPVFHQFSLTRGRGGYDRMVVGFITTYAISAYHH